MIDADPRFNVELSVDDLLLKYARLILERDGLRERLAQVLTANEMLTRSAAAPAEMPAPIRPLDATAFTDEGDGGEAA